MLIVLIYNLILLNVAASNDSFSVFFKQLIDYDKAVFYEVHDQTHDIILPYYYGKYKNIDTLSIISSGYSNTAKIIDSFNIRNIEIAATYCNTLNINGYNDWYLPSIDELIALKNNLINRVFKYNLYWSSSQQSKEQAFALYVYNNIYENTVVSLDKKYNAAVLCIRSYTLTF